MNPTCTAWPEGPILVTGSSGFIGSKLVDILLEHGVPQLRCFVRPSSVRGRLDQALSRYCPAARVNVISGELMSREDCRKAVDGVSVIYHLAAGIEKSFAGAFMNSVLTTRNLIEAFAQYGKPGRFVNVSSFAVYSNLTLKRGALLDETCPLEDSSQERGDGYAFGKLKQEQLVREYGARLNVPFVVMRPGAVFGPGKPSLSGRIGINTFGFFLHMGSSNQLPLTFVDNCAEAILLAGIQPGVEGETFNVVDDDLPTSRQFLRAYRKRVSPFFSAPMPYVLSYALSLLWETYSRKSKGQLPPVFNRRRCAAEWKGNRYSNEKLHRLLGWNPRVPMNVALDSFLAQFERRTP